MKKNIIIIIAAVIVAAGLGTGAFFGARSSKTEPAIEAESTVETTTEAEPEYGEFNITKEEYDKYEPIQQTAVTDFVKGKLYAPTQYDSGYGLANINWSSDGRTVTVAGPSVFGGYAIYKLNEFGEPTLVTACGIACSDSESTQYGKTVIKPTYVYNDKHWVIKLSDEAETTIYNHDSNGNITGICYSDGNTENEKYTYDEYGNIVKCEYYDSVVTVEYELNSIGLPTKKQEFNNGSLSQRYTNEFSYVEVSEAQYNFYKQIIKTLKFSQAHAID